MRKTVKIGVVLTVIVVASVIAYWFWIPHVEITRIDLGGGRASGGYTTHVKIAVCLKNSGYRDVNVTIKGTFTWQNETVSAIKTVNVKANSEHDVIITVEVPSDMQIKEWQAHDLPLSAEILEIH